MQNSMVMFTFSVLDWKHSFFTVSATVPDADLKISPYIHIHIKIIS